MLSLIRCFSSSDIFVHILTEILISTSSPLSIGHIDLLSEIAKDFPHDLHIHNLSFIKLFQLPQGGSITLASMLPIMVFAYSYGMKKGLLVGFIYGLLQSIQDPFIIHPAQFLLDYPVAFTMLGFSGAFASFKPLEKLPQVKFALGALISSVFRFASHVISGVFAFGAYAEAAGASNHLLYSLAYNSFVFIELAIVVVVGAILFSSKTFKTVIAR